MGRIDQVIPEALVIIGRTLRSIAGYVDSPKKEAHLCSIKSAEEPYAYQKWCHADC